MNLKNLVFILVCLILIFAGSYTTVSADVSGVCGDNLTWTLDDNGTITISGTGPMDNWTNSNQPWKKYLDSIKEVVISEGVTYIGCDAFYPCVNLLNVSIPKSVECIGYSSFDSTSLVNGNGYWWQDSFYIDDCLIYGSMITGEDIIIKPGTRVIAAQSYGFSARATNFILPESLECISEQAFAYSKATSIMIPKTVHTIDIYAFYKCDQLTDIYYEGSSKEWSQIIVWYGNDRLKKVKVHYNYVPAYDISFQSQSETMYTGGKKSLTVDILPNYTTDEIIWESSDTSVATVNEGTITAISAGKTIITASVGNSDCYAECEITVVPKPEIKKLIVTDLGAYGINSLAVNVEIDNIPSNARIYTASYDSCEKALECKYLSADNLRTNFNRENVFCVKVFVWDENMVPLSNSKELYVSDFIEYQCANIGVYFNDNDLVTCQQKTKCVKAEIYFIFCQYKICMFLFLKQDSTQWIHDGIMGVQNHIVDVSNFFVSNMKGK